MDMQRCLKFLIVSIVCAVLTGCNTLREPDNATLQKGDFQPAANYLSRYIPREMKRSKIVGLSVALVHDQKIVWSGGFGFSDMSANKPVSTQTLFRAGSVSKLFTSTAIMQLSEAGKLELDAPLRLSVPEFSIQSRFGTTDTITLRNTLMHRAGLPSSILDGMWVNNPDSFRTVAKRLQNYYTRSKPGDLFGYSNVGYTLAGIAAENVSGVPFERYMEEQLLKPMGMLNSNFRFDVSDKQVSRSYFNNKLVEETGLRDLPAGGLVTSIDELSAMVKMINARGLSGSNQILKPETVDEMLRPQQFESPYALSQGNGIGWHRFADGLNGNYRAIGHDGQTLAHSAFLVTVPELRLGVVALANSPNLVGSLQTIAEEVLRLAYPVATGQTVPDEKRLKPQFLPGVQTSLAGQYATQSGLLEVSGDASPYTVRLAKTKLTLKEQANGEHHLFYKLLGIFPIEAPPFHSIDFQARTVAGKRIIIATKDDTSTLVATEISSDKQSLQWHERLGEYKITNPLETDIPLLKVDSFSLGFRDDFYYLTIRRSGEEAKLPLLIIDDRHAVMQGMASGLGETITFNDEGLLDYSGLLLEKI